MEASSECALISTLSDLSLRSSVIRVMLESGFLTKSNFNREFLRVTGTSPTAWRQLQKTGDEAVKA